MTEPIPAVTEPERAPATDGPRPGSLPHEHRPNRLYQAAAWVSIVAGVVFIVGAVFFAGFALGRYGGPGWGPGGMIGRHHDGMPPRPPMGGDDEMGPGMMGPGMMGPGMMGPGMMGPGMMGPGGPGMRGPAGTSTEPPPPGR